MKSIVTGATGFLGQHLARVLLLQGDEVTIVHRSSSAHNPILDEMKERGATIALYENLDEMDTLVRRARPDRVFHLATLYMREHGPTDIEKLVEANVTFGARLLESVVGLNCVVVSTMSYFQFRNGEPSSFSLYSATKQAFLDIANYYLLVKGLDVLNVILFDTFGPCDTRDKLIPRLLDAAAEGSRIDMGTSAQLLNLLYVDDVVAGLVAAAAPESGALVSLRSTEETTVAELVRTVERAGDRTIQKSYNEDQRPNPLVREAGVWPSPDGWVPQVPLRDGIERSWAWRLRHER